MLLPAFTLCLSCYLFSGFGGVYFVLGFFRFVGLWGLVLFGFVVFFLASVLCLHPSHAAFFHVKSVFPIQMPKASRTSVQGCKNPPVAAQAVSGKGFQASHEEDLGGMHRARFHFDFCRRVLEQQSTEVTGSLILENCKILGNGCP